MCDGEQVSPTLFNEVRTLQQQQTQSQSLSAFKNTTCALGWLHFGVNITQFNYTSTDPNTNAHGQTNMTRAQLVHNLCPQHWPAQTTTQTQTGVLFDGVFNTQTANNNTWCMLLHECNAVCAPKVVCACLCYGLSLFLCCVVFCLLYCLCLMCTNKTKTGNNNTVFVSVRSIWRAMRTIHTDYVFVAHG